jgi:uncharacterized protein YjbI with pentapeptide repeats
MEKVNMRQFKLVTTDNHILYEGRHPSLRHAVEYAIKQNINLQGVHLADTDLQHINLDGVRITGANFSGADLSGANMSEADFIDCDFSEADLSKACLCYSNIKNCNFKFSSFFGTDIAMISFVSCRFEGFYALHLEFHKAFKLESLTFTHFEKDIPFSSPPTLIRHRDTALAILGNVLFYKEIPHTFDHKFLSKRIIPSAQP